MNVGTEKVPPEKLLRHYSMDNHDNEQVIISNEQKTSEEPRFHSSVCSDGSCPKIGRATS